MERTRLTPIATYHTAFEHAGQSLALQAGIRGIRHHHPLCEPERARSGAPTEPAWLVNGRTLHKPWLDSMADRPFTPGTMGSYSISGRNATHWTASTAKPARPTLINRVVLDFRETMWINPTLMQPTQAISRRGKRQAVTHDAAGHLTSDGSGKTYVYNQAGQLSQVKQGATLLATYYYNYLGERSRKVTTAAAPQGAQTVFYHYDQQSHLIAETSGSGAPLRTYVWRDDAPLAQIEYVPSRRVLYYELDQTHTPRAATDSTGKLVWRWDSDAFGSSAANEDPDGDGVKTTVNLRFPGQYYDQESGLHQNYFRDYDPRVGRYVEADPIGLAGGMNPYGYANSNPLEFIDPLGLASLVTNRADGTTTFDPRPEDPAGVPFTIPTRNGVDHRALPGAQDAFSTPDVRVRHRTPSRSYGPNGAYIDTGDHRNRNIHGGGSCPNNNRGDSQAPRQGWCVTMGCTRGQNEDVTDLGAQIEDFKRRHPGTRIPYTRN